VKEPNKLCDFMPGAHCKAKLNSCMSYLPVNCHGNIKEGNLDHQNLL